jgi:hypothetical protein
MNALKEIVRKLSLEDQRVLCSLPPTGTLFIRGGDYDFACNLYNLGLVGLSGSLQGWSAYASRTDRGAKVVELISRLARK